MDTTTTKEPTMDKACDAIFTLRGRSGQCAKPAGHEATGDNRHSAYAKKAAK